MEEPIAEFSSSGSLTLAALSASWHFNRLYLCCLLFMLDQRSLVSRASVLEALEYTYCRMSSSPEALILFGNSELSRKLESLSLSK